MNLDFAKVCGKHSAIYEAYYKQIDPKGSGAIEAMTAAKFLKKSGLSDVVLSRVWDLSDPNGKGFLDKPGFFVALKLVSLAQAGQVANMNNIYVELANPPKVGDIPKIMPPRIQTVPVSSGGVANGDWSISVIDRLKYEQLFESLKPVNGMLPGNKVKGVLMDSKLPMETLGKIWDLADQDKDGNLDKHEFLVAMHLVYQTLEKRTVPDVLPVELRKTGTVGPPTPKPMPPVVNAAAPGVPRAPSGEGFSDGGFVANFPKDIAPPPVVPPLPAAIPPMARVPPVGGVQSLISTDPLIPIGAPPSVTANADWVVIPSELKRYEVIFRDSDRDKDGLVSGLEVKNVFLQSGVPQQCLAHIWALCDTNQSGKLTLEQFALAMWMVERKQKGIEPPQVLTANMVPPSMRGIVSGVDLQPQAEPKPTYSNPELEMISKEIEELAKERRALETEIAQKEADIRIKSGEVRSLQSELDTLSATLKQLENQRGEAQKRLDDLKAQVNKIREQCQKQEDTINEQEGELNAKRSELQKLKDEETALQQEYDENNRELQSLTKHLQNTQLQISSVRSMVTQLMEAQRQMTDALLMCRAAIENQDGELVSEYQLKIEPDFDDARKTLEKKIEDPKPDPFEATANTNTAQPLSNGFATNGFSNDPFAGGVGTTNTIRSGFDDSFNTGGFDSGFDAFGSGGGFGQQKDPFGSDAFGGSKPSAVTPEPGKDDFGSDPFAALHAPTGQGQVLSPNTQKSGPPPRPESPSPALPPKKSKVPPPRPAPPRPVQGPPRPSSATDGFGSTSNSGGFADFADFDNKLTSIPQSTTSTSSPVFSSSWLSPPLTAPKASLDDMSLFDVVPTTVDATMTTRTSPITQAFASSTTATITKTTENNHLTRSITPLQQAAGVLKSMTTTTTTKTTTQMTAAAIDAAPKARIPLGPTDFSDDPFKDYRYEDPFNIKDPFDDTDNLDPDQVFKDDLSSDDEKKPKGSDSSAFARIESHIPKDFVSQFDNFQISPSPVPSQKSTASGGNLSGNGTSFGFTQNHNSRSQRNTPVLTSAAASGNQFDSFADFDAFSTKSSSTIGSLGTGTKEKSASRNSNSNSINNNNTNDSFFEAFNDNFDTNSNAELKKPKAANILSAFGDTKDDAFKLNSANIVAANVFEDTTFEDDFFKLRSNNSTKDTSDFNFDININNNKSVNIDNFAKFDAFGDNSDFASDFATALNNSINTTTKISHQINENKLQKIQNETKKISSNNKMANEQVPAKPPQKFVADYSNADSFDADLEEALKRSMFDK